MNGEFHFVLTEKTDRNHDTYLFGGLEFLNAVIFIRPEPTAPGEAKRWRAVLKPYKPKTPNELSPNVWDSDSVAPDNQSPRNEGKRK